MTTSRPAYSVAPGCVGGKSTDIPGATQEMRGQAQRESSVAPASATHKVLLIHGRPLCPACGQRQRGISLIPLAWQQQQQQQQQPAGSVASHTLSAKTIVAQWKHRLQRETGASLRPCYVATVGIPIRCPLAVHMQMPGRLASQVKTRWRNSASITTCTQRTCSNPGLRAKGT